MSLFKVPNSKFWQYKFMINGQVYKGSTKRTRKTEAKEVEDGIRTDVLNRKQLGHLPEITLHDAVRYWLDHYAKSIASYENMNEMAKVMFEGSTKPRTLRRWTWPKDLLFHQLTEGHVKRMVDIRISEGLGSATIKTEISILSRTRNQLEGLFQVPSIRWPSSKRDKRIKPPVKKRHLDADEVRLMLEDLDPANYQDDGNQIRFEAHRQDAYDLAITLLNTGMRPMEAMSLTWQQVSLNAKTIHTHRTKVGNWSTLGMSQPLFEVMERRYRERDGNPYVFPNRSIRKAADQPHMTHCRIIQRAIDNAGCNTPDKLRRYGHRATMYTLRDTFASRLLQSGEVSLKGVSQLLGHTTTKMTEKYADLIPDVENAKAVSVLNGLAADAR